MGLETVILCLIGILAGLGVGSGGLYLVYLRLFTDTPQKEAQGLNLCFFIFALFAAVLFHVSQKTYNNKALIRAIPFGIPAAMAGSYLATVVAPETLRTVLGIVFIVAALYTLIFAERGQNKNSQSAGMRKKTEMRPKKT